MTENEIAKIVIDVSMHIHKTLGPGLLESVYEAVLAYELRQRGLHLETQVPIPVIWQSVQLEVGFRADMIVEGKLLIELKSVEHISPVFKKILLTYLRLSGMRLGLVVNFGAELLKEGIARVVHGLPET